MKRLTIDEIIEHCDRKTSMYEKACDIKYLETTTMNNPIKEYWEHKQVAEYLRKLKAYESLEEQGRLIKLPCKVGDTVYAIVYDYEVEQYAIKESEIIEVRENINGIFFVSLINKPAFKFNDFGKTVFLKKSEAETKLKELRGSND